MNALDLLVSVVDIVSTMIITMK